jgi:hypothetical protein
MLLRSAGAPDTPLRFYAIVTTLFENQSGMDAAMKIIDTAVNYISNITNTKPIMLCG